MARQHHSPLVEFLAAKPAMASAAVDAAWGAAWCPVSPQTAEPAPTWSPLSRRPSPSPPTAPAQLSVCSRFSLPRPLFSKCCTCSNFLRGILPSPWGCDVLRLQSCVCHPPSRPLLVSQAWLLRPRVVPAPQCSPHSVSYYGASCQSQVAVICLGQPSRQVVGTACGCHDPHPTPDRGPKPQSESSHSYVTLVLTTLTYSGPRNI